MQKTNLNACNSNKIPVNIIALIFRLSLKHWRCGGILCSVCLVPLLIKDTKAHCLFYSSVLFVG